MKVVKRDGKIVDFDDTRIINAVGKANGDVDEKDQASEDDINKIVRYIKNLKKKRILVEDIQDIIEQKLMEFGKYNLARAYITYRYTRALVRKANTTDQSIKELINGD